MPPISPIPLPLPPWARWAKWLIEAGLVAAWRVYSDMHEYEEETGPASWPEWRQYVVGFQRLTPVGTTEDHAVMTFDVINVTDGAFDNTWTLADYQACEGLFDTFTTALRSQMTDNHILSSAKWYQRKWRPEFHPTKPFAPSGPPARLRSLAQAGLVNSSGSLPYQTAVSVTERTALPKHWGRFYIPGFQQSVLDNRGRITAVVRDAVANWTRDLYQGLVAADFYPVVPVTQIDKQPVRGLLGIRQVAVDDIPDVQRRRRARQVAARSVRGAA